MIKRHGHTNTHTRTHTCLRTGGVALLQRVPRLLQACQGGFPFVGEGRSTGGVAGDGLGEEAGAPLLVLLLADGRFLALLLFEFLFEFRGFGVASFFDGGGHGGPEALGFVGELVGERGDDFGEGEEGAEVDEEGGVL